MALSESHTNDNAADDGWARTTHWGTVLDARAAKPGEANDALAKLCQTYWHPIYTYIRRSGHGPEDAQDLTQEFFVRLMEKDYLKTVASEKGKFRSFLLVVLKRFLANERIRANRQKRGGGQEIISLDAKSAEGGYLVEPVDHLSPDQLFERRWAQTIMEQALHRLHEHYAATGQTALFEQLKDLQPGEHGSLTYAQLGAQLGMTESAIRAAAHRMRLRHRQLLREEIAHTVSRPEQIDEEIRYLLSVLGN